MRPLISIAAILIVTACAKAPENIEPLDLGNKYANISCAAASEAHDDYADHLAWLEKQQKSARASDTAGVLLWGLPFGSIAGGDKEDEIASAKGEMAALAQRLSSC